MAWAWAKLILITRHGLLDQVVQHGEAGKQSRKKSMQATRSRYETSWAGKEAINESPSGLKPGKKVREGGRSSWVKPYRRHPRPWRSTRSAPRSSWVRLPSPDLLRNWNRDWTRDFMYYKISLNTTACWCTRRSCCTNWLRSRLIE